MNLYLLFKSLHLISVISWMAGLLYLPRIFVYHSEANHESQKNVFKVMGMVQSQRNGNGVYKIGCLGKISDLQKSNDGRILINLTGITRFKILEEINNKKLYREFKVDYKYFELDLKNLTEDLNTESLMNKAKVFFKKNGLLLNWKEFEKLNRTQKINTLSMISPVTNEEKQKLLEAQTERDKIETLENIINFYLHDVNFNNLTVQ